MFLVKDFDELKVEEFYVIEDGEGGWDVCLDVIFWFVDDKIFYVIVEYRVCNFIF